MRIGSYLKSDAVFQCPTDPTPGTNDPTQAYGAPQGTPSYSDYGYNWALSSIAESRFSYPTRTVTFIDIISGPAWVIATDPRDELSQFSRHSGGGNCAFADGHVKWFSPNQVHPDGIHAGPDSICNADTSAATFCVF